MFDSKNVLYILTMLEAIEKIFIYSADFEDEEKFYLANKQLNFNARTLKANSKIKLKNWR